MKKLTHILLPTLLLLSVGCTPRVSVEHLNNYTSRITASESVELLWLPIEDAAPEALIIAEGEGCNGTPMMVRLAHDRVDYYLPFAMKGVEALRVERCAYGNLCWQELRSSTVARSDEFRQRVHFSTERGWINDPNGMFYLNGEWHLYYQHNPYGARWGNMSWGHAVSHDLVSWKHLPTVLYPDELGAIFSGSAVVDRDNTAGFGEGAVVAIYTSAGARQSQSIAYSLDGGTTFTKYENNPVLTSHRIDFRDPKVFWYAPTERWIMVLAAGNAMEIYSSENLRQWQFESRCGEDWGYHTGVWECPDLFELPYEGGSKWVLLCSLDVPQRGGSSVQYFVGEFDGHTFTPDHKSPTADCVNYGRDYYAAVSWSGVEDGRRVVVGWQNNWQYANDLPLAGYRGYMSLPQQLSLVSHNGSPKLVARLVDEFIERCKVKHHIPQVAINDCTDAWQQRDKDSLFVVECDIVRGSAEAVGVKLFNDSGEWVDVCLDFGKEELKVDRTNSGNTTFHPTFASVSEAPLSANNTQRLTIVVDRTSVECFTDIAALSNLVFPAESYSRVSFYAIGGEAAVCDLNISEIE